MKKITMELTDSEIAAMKNHLRYDCSKGPCDFYLMKFQCAFLDALLKAEEVQDGNEADLRPTT